MYILDSDIFDDLVYPSVYRPRLVAKINEVGQSNVWFSVITAYEKLDGLLAEIRRLLNPRNQSLAPHQVEEFEALITLLGKLSDSQILPFTGTDFEHYRSIFAVLRKAPLDCRIGASARSRNWIVVTRNKADFGPIRDRAGVRVEYWADPQPVNNTI